MTFLGISAIEWVGYTASVIVAVSLTMTSIVKLRWFNLAGAGVFSAYGFVIGALPVGFLNLFIALIDLYYLAKLHWERSDFLILAVKASDELRDHYLEVHKADIAKFAPQFDRTMTDTLESFWLLKNSVPIGLLAGKRRADTLEIVLDYVGPEYRDFKMGTFVYSSGEYFKSLGIRTLAVAVPGNPHENYLKKMKLERVGDRFEKRF